MSQGDPSSPPAPDGEGAEPESGEHGSTPPAWHRVEALFHQAVELAPEERQRLLSTLDRRLAAEVGSLLDAAHRDSGEEQPLVDGVVAASLEWLAEDKPADDLPDAIGPYRLLRELGRGGFGTVYLAEREEEDFRLEVAIKRGRHELENPLLEERFRLERRLLARFEHPNIARLFDGGTDTEGRPYLVMERVDGLPIDHFCDQRRRTVRQRIGLMLRVCDAVAYAHRNLVIHRDLKPSNILVSTDGTPKLLDFGIAKRLDATLGDRAETAEDPAETAGDPTLTLYGLVPFTPEYASPEQVRGETLTTASDVYSLGVLLYRLLCGRPPYRLPRTAPPARIERVIGEAAPPALARALVEKDATPPAPVLAERRSASVGALSRELRGDLENIVAKAIHKESERRYGSVRELADDLRRYLVSQPVAATGDSTAYVLGRFVRRHRLAVASVLLVALSLTAGLVGTTLQMRQAQRHRARAEQVTRLLEDDVIGSADPARARGEQPTLEEILDRSKGRLDRRLASNPEIHGKMLATVGRLYQKLGAYDRALVLLQRGREQIRRGHGEEHPETVRATADLADAAYDLGRLAMARDLLSQAIVDQRRLGISARADLATSLHRLAMVERDVGDGETAQGLLEEALSLRDELFGSESPWVADSLAVRAQLDYQRGDTELAESTARRVLDIRRRILGRDHPDTLVSINDLAVMVQARGDLESAAPLLRETVELNRHIHGEGHRNLANAQANLAWVLGRQGQLGEAITLLDEAREIHRRVLGPSHPAVLTDQRNLARLLQRSGALDRAAELLGDNLRTVVEQSGADSLATGRALLDLATLGSAARRTLRARAELGLCLWAMNRPDEAWKHLEAGLEGLRAVLEADDPDLLWILDRLPEIAQ